MRYRDLLKGRRYAFLIRATQAGQPMDLSSIPSYLFLVSGTARLRLKYEPNGEDNQGTFELHGSVPKVAFRLSAEQTRSLTIEPGNYQIYAHVGPLSGLTGEGEYIGGVRVTTLADGNPVS